MGKTRRTNLIRVKDRSSNGTGGLWAAAVISIVILACILLLFLNSDKKADEVQLTTEEEILDQYVGPFDCEDRGEWFDPREYYSLFDEDGRPCGDFNAALFSVEDKKGIVPAGVILEPAYLCYDDFAPFPNLDGSGYLGAYSCEAQPQSAELQLGVSADFSLSSSYTAVKDACSGAAMLEITGMEYYITNTFDSERYSTDGSEYAETNGPYLKAHLSFDYKGSFCASADDGTGEQIIQSEFEGHFEDGHWGFDSDFSGQGNYIFPTGETYLRCRIPCTQTRMVRGSSIVTDSYVNVYFRVSEIRVGTRADVRPVYENEETKEE